MRTTSIAVLVLLALLAGCGSEGGTDDTDGGGGGDGGQSGPDGGGTTVDAATATYTETVCPDPLASLADLQTAYQNTASGIRAATAGIADRRYPIARAFIDFQSDSELGRWFQSTTTFDGVFDGFETAVHEGQHIWDIRMAGTDWPYRLRDDLIIRTRRLQNFNRSEISTIHAGVTQDSYHNVYLTGQSGAQGFNTLLDEYTAYVHSLAAKYCTRDSIPSNQATSARDGTLALMYYVELYLKLARTQHADDYAEILADPEHKRLILTNWARAEFWLDKAKNERGLGIRDSMYRTWVYDPANLMEIDLLRN